MQSNIHMIYNGVLNNQIKNILMEIQTSHFIYVEIYSIFMPIIFDFLATKYQKSKFFYIIQFTLCHYLRSAWHKHGISTVKMTFIYMSSIINNDEDKWNISVKMKIILYIYLFKQGKKQMKYNLNIIAFICIIINSWWKKMRWFVKINIIKLMTKITMFINQW